MSFDPLFAAPLVVQVHAFGAMAAFLLGIIQLTAPKGTLPHRALGVVWLLIMTTIAVSSIFIRPALFPGIPLGQWFSYIHIFTVLTFYGVIQGSLFLVRGGGNFKQHAKSFTGIFIGGLLIAGAFAFLPGRIMHQVVFGG